MRIMWSRRPYCHSFKTMGEANNFIDAGLRAQRLYRELKHENSWNIAGVADPYRFDSRDCQCPGAS